MPNTAGIGFNSDVVLELCEHTIIAVNEKKNNDNKHFSAFESLRLQSG